MVPYQTYRTLYAPPLSYGRLKRKKGGKKHTTNKYKKTRKERKAIMGDKLSTKPIHSWKINLRRNVLSVECLSGRNIW
jgi:hypothetical protein